MNALLEDKSVKAYICEVRQQLDAIYEKDSSIFNASDVRKLQDKYLLPMLRKNDMNVEKTVENLKECLIWFKEKNVANITDLSFPLEYFKTGEIYVKCGKALDGSMVFYKRSRNINNATAMREFHERLTAYTACKFIFETESIDEKITVVYDMTNVSLENIDVSLGFQLIRFAARNVPDEVIENVLIYNVSWMVKPIIKTFLPLLPSRFSKKIKVVGPKDITDYIDEENLAPFIRNPNFGCVKLPNHVKCMNDIDLEAIGIKEEDKLTLQSIFKKYTKD